MWDKCGARVKKYWHNKVREDIELATHSVQLKEQWSKGWSVDFGPRKNSFVSVFKVNLLVGDIGNPNRSQNSNLFTYNWDCFLPLAPIRTGIWAAEVIIRRYDLEEALEFILQAVPKPDHQVLSKQGPPDIGCHCFGESWMIAGKNTSFLVPLSKALCGIPLVTSDFFSPFFF